jgi:hypothetical protein
MTPFDDQPDLGEGRQIHLHVDQSSVKFVRNSKGDHQIELKTVAGTTAEQMRAIRELAYAEYRLAVESIGGILPPVAS